MPDRPRRYPPSPYPPRTQQTKEYRDGWDLGWRHVTALGIQACIEHHAKIWGPYQHGYSDGVVARVEKLERDARTEPYILRQERALAEQRLRDQASTEQPY